MRSLSLILFSVLVLAGCTSKQRPFRLVDGQIIPSEGYEVAYANSTAIVYDKSAYSIKVFTADGVAKQVFIQSQDPNFTLDRIFPGIEVGSVTAEELDSLMQGDSLVPADIQCCRERACNIACYITYPGAGCVCVDTDACPGCTGTCIIDYDGTPYCDEGTMLGPGGTEIDQLITLSG